MKAFHLAALTVSILVITGCSGGSSTPAPEATEVVATPFTSTPVKIHYPEVVEETVDVITEEEVIAIITEEVENPTYFTSIPFDPSINPAGIGWADSYSVGDRCYMYTTFDHGIGDIEVETPYGIRTVSQVHQLLGEGDIDNADAFYNTVQCGHAPDNSYWDELEGACRGRVDMGGGVDGGCGIAGPKWKFDL